MARAGARPSTPTVCWLSIHKPCHKPWRGMRTSNARSPSAMSRATRFAPPSGTEFPIASAPTIARVGRSLTMWPRRHAGANRHVLASGTPRSRATRCLPSRIQAWPCDRSFSSGGARWRSTAAGAYCSPSPALPCDMTGWDYCQSVGYYFGLIVPTSSPDGLTVVLADVSILGHQVGPGYGRVTHDHPIERIPGPSESPGRGHYGSKVPIILG